MLCLVLRLLLLVVTIVIVSMRLRPVHMVRGIRSIPMMARVVLGSLVPMHWGLAVLHVVVHVGIRVWVLVVSSALVVVIFIRVILNRMHSIVLVSFSFVILLLFCR